MNFFKKRANGRMIPEFLDLTTLSDVTYFLEHHPDAVYTMDPDGHFMSFNNKFPLLLGYEREQLHQLHFDHFLPPEDQTRIHEYKRQALSGETVHFTVTIRSKTNHPMTLNVTNIPIYDQRLIIGLYGIVRDVSQQKELQSDYQRLLTKERLMESIGGVTFIEYIPTSKEVRTTASLGAFLEIPQKRLEHMDVYDFLEEIHPEDREPFSEQVNALLQKEISETSIRLRMGRRKQFKKVIHCDGLIQSEQSTPSLLFTLRDETSSIQLERERDLAITSLKKFFTTLHTTVYEQRYEDGHITFHADGFLEPYEKELRRIEEDPTLRTRFIDPQDHDLVTGAQPKIKKGEVVHLIYRLIYHDTLFWIEETCIPIMNDTSEVTGYYGISTDITQLKEQQRQIQHLSMHDPVTTLPNRAFILDHLTNLLSYRASFTLIGITFNQHSVMYERFGHDVGDEWMRQTSAKIKQFVPKKTFLGHLFGDKFLVIIENIDEPQAIEIGHAMLELTHHRFDILSYEFFTKVYVGITHSNQQRQTAEELLKQIYKALRRGKSLAKSNVQLYSSQLDIATFRQYQLEHDLRYILTRKELFLEFQPKVDSWSGRVVGAEALIRWNHPEWGRIAPKDFLALSEESDLYIHIGDWVLDQTCLLIRELLDEQPENVVPLSINLSPKRLFYGDFATVVEASLKRHRIPGHLLEIELLESDMLLEGGSVEETLERLVQLGVTLSLDDFGTAYSSIAYLQRYPIHCLKIDRSFTIDAEHNPKSLSVVKSIVFMAKEFNLTIVAEGIENIKQLELYRDLECEMIQGYLFSKPVPIDEMKELLREGMLYPKETGTASPKESILSLHAQMTISKLKGKTIQVGASPILINRSTSRSVWFYSSIRLPVRHDLELSLQLSHLSHPDIILHPITITELDNGLFYYMSDYHIRALSLIVQEQLNASSYARVDDFFDHSSD